MSLTDYRNTDGSIRPAYRSFMRTQLIEDLRQWYLNNNKLRQACAVITDPAFNYEAEFDLFITGGGEDKDYITDCANFGEKENFEEYDGALDDDITEEEAESEDWGYMTIPDLLEMNKENLVIRLTSRLCRDIDKDIERVTERL